MLALCLVAACSAPPEAERDASVAAAVVAPERADLVHALDARVPPAELAPALFAADAALRRSAVIGLGNYRRGEALPLLRRALADPAPAVRAAAAAALALQPELTPIARERELLAALAAEPPGPGRGLLLRAIAPALVELPGWLAAAADTPAERCDVMASLAQRGRPLGAQPNELAVALPDADPPARAACLEALAAAAEHGWTPDSAAARALEPLLAGDEPEPRRAAARVLLGGPALPWDEALLHRDPLVRLLAARRAALGPMPPGAPVRLAAARRQLDEFLAQPARFGQPHLHALLVTLASLGGDASDPSVSAAAAAMLRALAQAEGSAPARGWALVRCALAELVDRAKRWPARVRGCGGEQIPPDVAAAAEVRVLASGDESDDLRLDLLQAQLAKGGVHVQREVVRAASSLAPPLRARLLDATIRRGAPEAQEDALHALARAAHWGETERSALRFVEQSPLREAPGVARAWLETVRLAGERSPATALQLASAPQPDLQRAARALLTEWGLEGLAPAQRASLDERPEVPEALVLPADRVPAPHASFELELATTAGPLVIALDPDRTPVAAVRIAELARAGHYDEQPVAAVSPGQLVALGPATPGHLRHEGPPIALARGDVALRDFGRDAVTGQLLVALEARPELAGQLTVVGRVKAGLDVLDALTEADQLLQTHVRVR